MRPRTAGFVLVALTGCGVTPASDAGPPDHGLCASVPFPTRPTYGAVGELLSVTIPGGPTADCSATAVVRSPSGASETVAVDVAVVDGGSRESKVSLNPTSAGEWSVVVTWTAAGSSSEQTLTFPVFDWAQTGEPITQVFPDRMDNCGGPSFGRQGAGVTRSLSGLTLCQRSDGKIWAYTSDGGALPPFAGEQLRVVGDEVWTTASGRVEHRTAIGETLQFDGALTFEPIPQSCLPPMTTVSFNCYRENFFEVSPGRLTRSFVDGVETFLWDGSTLSHFASEASGAQVMDTNGRTWSVLGQNNVCQIQRGCTTGSCVVACPAQDPGIWLSLATPDALWGVGGINGWEDGRRIFTQVIFVMMPRPLELGVRSTANFMFPAIDNDVLPFGPQQTAPYLDTRKHVLLVHRKGGLMDFSLVRRTGPTLDVNRDWVITQGADVFTVTFTPINQ